jgi:hypothetical protein
MTASVEPPRRLQLLLSQYNQLFRSLKNPSPKRKAKSKKKWPKKDALKVKAIVMNKGWRRQGK